MGKEPPGGSPSKEVTVELAMKGEKPAMGGAGGKVWGKGQGQGGQRSVLG